MPLHSRDDCLPLGRRDVYLTLVCYFRNTCNIEELHLYKVLIYFNGWYFWKGDFRNRNKHESWNINMVEVFVGIYWTVKIIIML